MKLTAAIINTISSITVIKPVENKELKKLLKLGPTIRAKIVEPKFCAGGSKYLTLMPTSSLLQYIQHVHWDRSQLPSMSLKIARKDLELLASIEYTKVQTQYDFNYQSHGLTENT